MKNILSNSGFFGYTVTASMVLLVIVGWWFLCYNTLQAHIARYKTQINTCNRQKKRYLVAQLESEQVAADLKNLKQEYQQKVEHISGYTITQALTWIIDCLKQQGILLQQCILEKSQAQDWYTFVPCSISYWATFDQVLAFFVCLEKSPYCITCNACTFERLNDTMLSCSLRIYFLEVHR